ncbi:MAG: NAD-dependent dehydratase [Elusimicrobia bacterium CG1_02_37_114]|nr:MAG: NAD-dependent dehydratase [Elusimicrobia bacterium CG1_02_37_114]PIV53192.1 MAG: NAD-dependent dehydratase [Elusimicrobia bacterium CG02_land_8_20_14_3_00_37_13]PIZ14115.1 MAG: NAD-dependent dehydratase [Elusimicrobia bacterium CG_4_10_14_0_8_um_filter_37_32]
MNLKNKRVLVTGADGFIGSHLVEKLIPQVSKVRAFIKYNIFNDIGNLKYIDKKALKNVEIIFGDIQEQETVRAIIRNIDIVFNLAALISIPYSYQHPQETIMVNTIGTLNVLTTCKSENVERIIQTSTSEVYGSALYVPIDEKHPLQGQSPYSASKIAADKIAESFYKSYGMKVSIIRPFNTYGPRQSERAVIPTIITQVLTKDKLILGSTSATRDFNYVEDTAEGFIKIAKSSKSIGEVINIGSGREVSIGELAKKIMKLCNREVKIVYDKKRFRPKKSEVHRLLADNRKAKKLIGWKPQFSLEEGLKKTIDWIKNNLEIYHPGEYKL